MAFRVKVQFKFGRKTAFSPLLCIFFGRNINLISDSNSMKVSLSSLENYFIKYHSQPQRRLKNSIQVRKKISRLWSLRTVLVSLPPLDPNRARIIRREDVNKLKKAGWVLYLQNTASFSWACTFSKNIKVNKCDGANFDF